MYQMLHYLDQRQLAVPAGFIHLPASHELAVELKRKIPSLSLDTLISAVQYVIEELPD